MANVKPAADPLPGAAQPINDIMAGHINLMSVSVSLVGAAVHRDHKLKVLAVGSPRASRSFPICRRSRRAASPALKPVTWFGLAAPAARRREIVTKINADVKTVLNDPVFRAQLMMPQMFESMAEHAGGIRRLHPARDPELGEDHRRRN